MKIELIHCSLHTIKLNMIRKKITLPTGSKIEDVLPLVYGKGLALWREYTSKELHHFNSPLRHKYPSLYRIEGCKGRVISEYKSKGKLISNGKYFVLSCNVRKTIEVLKKL